MNAFLAQLYGTAQVGDSGPSSSDVEKLAEAKVLDSFFESEGIDVNTLDDSTILKVASELFGQGSALVKEAEEKGDEEHKPEAEEGTSEHEGAESPKEEAKEESMEEKAAQADFLGRVMAHSFHQESQDIQKKASAVKPEGSTKKAGVLNPSRVVRNSGETKSASALDHLAEQRALEMLKEAGYERGVDIPQKEPTEEEKLAFAVEQRALEMLAEAGYPVE